jgi:hypothetical protein
MPSVFHHLSTFPLVLIILILSAGNAAMAESGISAVLYPPQTEGFPVITTYMDIRSPQGEFIKGLGYDQIKVIENGSFVDVVNLEEFRPGGYFSIVVNPGPPFAIRDAHGRSRFDRLLEGLYEWAYENQSDTQDTISLFVPGGSEKIHLKDKVEVISALEEYQVNYHSSQANLDILTRAVDMTGLSGSHHGLGRGVLFVTSPPEGNLDIGVQTLIERAHQQDVHISVWLVSSTEQFDSPGSRLLEELALQTGGRFFTFSGVEKFPDIEEYLELIRDIYRIEYTSNVLTEGEHQVYLEIHYGQEKILTETRSFSLDIRPPNPVFISLPGQIQRVGVLKDRSNEVTITPDVVELEILVDFPDSRPRGIISSFLIVDGEIAADNQSYPYDKFRWDVSHYTESGVHVLQVTVVDELGLNGTSIQIPVVVDVILPKITVWTIIAQNGTLLAAFAVIFSGAVLLIVFVAGGRLNPSKFRRGIKKEPPTRPLKMFTVGREASDPLTQPVLGDEDKPEEITGKLPQWINRLPWPQRQASPPAFAYLIQFSEAEKGGNPAPIPLTVERIIFGRDPFKAGIVLKAPSVEPVHARLEREGATYRLSDAGSVAGTWVNYTPISQEGTLLEHGDLIHIGRVGFRFTLPASIRKPTVTIVEPEGDSN